MSENAIDRHTLQPLQHAVSVNLTGAASFDLWPVGRKCYTYHLCQSAWTGGLITFLQTSPESAPIFVILHKLFSAQKPSEFRETARSRGFSDGEVTALQIYTAGIFTNAGNYQVYGDKKFIPAVDASRFEQLLKISPVWKELEPLWIQFNLKIRMFEIGRAHLGYYPEGCTTYFSSNCNAEDSKRVHNWMQQQHVESYNTRCFKINREHDLVEYEIRLAAMENEEIVQKVQNEGYIYRLIKGDYSPLMKKVVQSLQGALPSAIQHERDMLQAFIRSFRTGSLSAHKEGTELFIQNKNPAIETYMGFIETHRDPSGWRGEFQAFVAAEKPMPDKFLDLMDNAKNLLRRLPWPEGFEKDDFIRPNFMPLDILAVSGSGIAPCINIRNYDDNIRQSGTFKSVWFANVLPASYQHLRTPFLSAEDAQLLQEWRVPAVELQLALHELLGHGSGKILCKEADGTSNFLPSVINPLTNQPVDSWYLPGETYESRFGAISTAYEECRAEAVGLYLTLELSVLSTFGHKGKEAEDVRYVNWLSLIWAGVRSLEMWDPDHHAWLEPNSQARFVLMRVLVEAGVAEVSERGQNDLIITLDKNMLQQGLARETIYRFLLQLQIFKSTGDAVRARNLFFHHSAVKEPWRRWRNIVLANKQPRNMLIQPNIIESNGDFMLQTYDSSLEGLIQSWLDRFPEPDPLYRSIIQLAEADLPYVS